MATIDPSRNRDAEARTRRQLLEERRARELEEVESQYNSQVKQSAERRGEAIKNVRRDEEDSIRSAQMDADHKVTLASQAADEQIRGFKSQTYNLTQDAARNLQEKAKLLEQTTRSVDEQRSHTLAAHADAMKKLQEENLQRREDIRAKYSSESSSAMTTADQALKSQTKAEEQALNKLRDSYDQRQRALESEKQIQYYSLADKNKRMQEELTQQSTVMEAKERDKQGKLLEQNSQRYNQALAKGQAQIEELRSNQNHALRELSTKGERDLRNLHYHLEQEESRETKANAEQLKTTRALTQKELQSLEQNLESQKKILERDHHKKISDLHRNQDLAMGESSKQTQDLQEKSNKDYLQQMHDLRSQHDTTYTENRDRMAKDIESFQVLGHSQVEQAKLDTSKKVSDIYAKAADPFYTIRRLEVSLRETPEALILSVPVPEYEQATVKVMANKNSFTITGTRRHEAKAEVTPGHQASTHSYQTFSETVVTGYPLEMGKLQREYASGVLTFTIPKA